MTRLEYELVREDRPDLMLPDFWRLHPEAMERLKVYTRERLIASRMAVLLGREVVSASLDRLSHPY